MTPRLPTVAGDGDAWGTVLNDYLGVAHESDGRLKAIPFNVAYYAAVGNGTADDTVAVQAAITAAVAVNGTVYSLPGKTYRITSRLSLAGACRFDFNGSTIKKSTTYTDTDALRISGSGWEIWNLVIDGNRTGGAAGTGYGSWITGGTGGKMFNVTYTGCKSHGIYQDASAATVEYHNSSFSSNSAGTGPSSGVSGLLVNQGVSKLYGPCEANSNESYGVYFANAAADGCHADVRTTRNGLSGVRIANNNGSSQYIRCVDDDSKGLELQSFSTTAGAKASGWTFDYVEVVDQGKTAGAIGIGSVHLSGAWNNHFGTVVIWRGGGYGIAFARNGTNPSVGSSFNVVGSYQYDGLNQHDTDPAIHISGDSNYNDIHTASVKNCGSVAVMTGEDTMPLPVPTNPINLNIHNHIGLLKTYFCVYGLWCCNIGHHNTIDAIHDVNSYNTSPKVIGGLVSYCPDRQSQIFTANWLNGAHTLPVGTITVTSTTGFTASGTFMIGDQTVTYTAKTSTTFTGCTGGTGTWATESTVKQGTLLPDASWCVANVVRYLSHVTESGFTKPSHIIHASTYARNNYLYDGMHNADYVTAEANNLGGSTNKLVAADQVVPGLRTGY
jgi:hypothetical protein